MLKGYTGKREEASRGEAGKQESMRKVAWIAGMS